MSLVQIVMPKMGESVMEGTILSWLKKVGEKVERDESLLEVATDKVDTEIPSTHAGILQEILVEKGQVVAVGSPIAIIATEGENNTSLQSQKNTVTAQPSKTETPAKVQEKVMVVERKESSKNGSSKFFSPLVLNIARQENISMAELDTIQGTGKDQRVTKNDILTYVQQRSKGGSKTYQTPQINTHSNETQTPEIKTSYISNGNDEIIEMDRMRKMIAERMLESKRISPHVTSFVEADVTNIVYWRNRMKHEFMEKERAALTFTPIFIEAVVKAIRDYPMVNISVDGDKIIVKKDINIGMAVALQSGNLIVPVIKNADQLNIIGLTNKVNDLAKRARDNKLNPDDLSHGTYTVTNVGSFGNVMGTPIIMQPQCAILALGAVVKKPSVIETPQGDTIGIRHKMFLSHSYDHRVIDGSLGGMFVRRVADYLESFDVNRKVFS